MDESQVDRVACTCISPICVCCSFLIYKKSASVQLFPSELGSELENMPQHQLNMCPVGSHYVRASRYVPNSLVSTPYWSPFG
jgi:hypothetical protein